MQMHLVNVAKVSTLVFSTPENPGESRTSQGSPEPRGTSEGGQLETYCLQLDNICWMIFWFAALVLRSLDGIDMLCLKNQPLIYNAPHNIRIRCYAQYIVGS
jgi:hypothetical protein